MDGRGRHRVYDWTAVDPAPAGTPGMRRIHDQLNLVVGTIVDLDVNGVLTAQCGDHLVTFEVADHPADVEQGGRIGVVVDDLQLWPFDRA